MTSFKEWLYCEEVYRTQICIKPDCIIKKTARGLKPYAREGHCIFQITRKTHKRLRKQQCHLQYQNSITSIIVHQTLRVQWKCLVKHTASFICSMHLWVECIVNVIFQKHCVENSSGCWEMGYVDDKLSQRSDKKRYTYLNSLINTCVCGGKDH